jgi:hypothetical protein
MRIFGIYNLLCDHCNLLFRGFAIPGTVPKHSGKKKRQQVAGTPEESER